MKFWRALGAKPSVRSTFKNSGLVKKIEGCVDKILADKAKSATADTRALEREIDALIYRLYGLTPEKIAVIEGKSPESEGGE